MGWVQNGSQGRVRKAECGETRPLRLERGKDREVLPIVTVPSVLDPEDVANAQPRCRRLVATANCMGAPAVSMGIPSKNVPVRPRPLLVIRSVSAVPCWIA